MIEKIVTGLAVVLVGAVLFVVYALPSGLAVWRHHPHRNAIMVANLLGGWTGWLWMIALVWVFVPVRPSAAESE